MVYANATCDGNANHCYTYAKRTTANRGGSVTIYINSGNAVQSTYAISNPLWIAFAGGDALEGGWEKGNIAPCSNTTAKFYTYTTVGTDSGICVGTTSGSTMTVQITDSDVNNVWQIIINGALKQSVYKAANSVDMEVCGESTYASNVLIGGRDTNLSLITTVVPTTSYSWGSTVIPTYATHTHNYIHSWNTQYTDFAYGGP